MSDTGKSIDLRNNTFTQKKRSNYDLNDEEIKTITLDNDVVIKLIVNNKGVFVDFRKYYKGYPTKKGIRVIASKFRDVGKILDEDIRRLMPEVNFREIKEAK
jgi:hypothetical protein